MAEQIPEAWIGQEVTVYYGPGGQLHTGTLEDVSERGISVRSEQGGKDETVSWYPLASVNRLIQGRARRPRS
jgi:hypothetical protein